MNKIEGIKTFLELVNTYWTTIAVCIGLCFSVYYKVKQFVQKSNDVKINQTMNVIRSVMLSLISDAELNYPDWKKAGDIKRAEVLNRIFNEYPILDKVVDKNELINRLDVLIDNSLVEMRKIFEQNESEYKLIDNDRE